jgi:hypothetical protein
VTTAGLRESVAAPTMAPTTGRSPADAVAMPSTPWTPITPEQIRRRRRLTLEVLWVCTIALLPWAVYLGIALPHQYSTRYWNVAWAGFDGLEILAFGATAYYGWRGRQAMIPAAIAAATLLICDAWFDIALNLGTAAIWGSVASAIFVELPLAFFLIHRIRLLLRLTLRRLYPAGDERGRPMSLAHLPLIGSNLGSGGERAPLRRE